MPVHHGSRTKVHLVAASLDTTTTAKPSNKKAPSITVHCEDVENDLKNGHVLKEKHIPLNGDNIPLHLLGGDGEYMPFMMVRAGEDLRQLPTAAKEPMFHPDPVRNAIFAKFMRPDRSMAIKAPQALALRVELSQQSFLKTNRPAEDIRIDVLFNGQLTHSNMWPKRLHQEERQKEQLTSVFGGLRNHWLLERAWVIVPPDQDTDGSQRQRTRSSESLEDRWKSIQQAVRMEAIARGTDKNGARPATAKYFMEVSKLGMPPELNKWCDPQGQKFGVIDVVLSYGHGYKDGLRKMYLSEPTRMRSPTFKQREVEQHTFEGIALQSELDTYEDVSRYNFRRGTPNAKETSSGSPAASSTPVRNTPGRDALLSPFSERLDTLAGPTVKRQGNTISASQKLPRHLSEAVTNAGYILQQPPTRKPMGPFAQTSGKWPPSHPSSGRKQVQGPIVTPPRPTSRSSAPFVIQLDDIPEEDEAMPRSSSGNVHTSAAPPKPGPLGFAGSSSLAFRSSSTTASPKSFGPPFGDPLHPAPPQTPSILPFRRPPPTSPSDSSPRKRRRLSRSTLPHLSIPPTTPPSGAAIGITPRGTFTTANSPRNRSHLAPSLPPNTHVNPHQIYTSTNPPHSPPRSRFASFTLTTPPTRASASIGRPPPISPLTPVRTRPSEPAIHTLVFALRGAPVFVHALAIPFRFSELPVLAALARDRRDCLIASGAATTTTTTTTTTGAPPPPPRRPPQPQPRNANTQSTQHARMERDFRSFAIPELSVGAAVTYAQPRRGGEVGEWREGAPRAFGGGVVRQVRSERMGEFEEGGVVCGVRFLVV